MAKHEATLAARLRSARKRAGLSQPELAERSGVPLQTLRQLEQGRRTDPYLSTVAHLAVALGVTIDHLAGLS
jgi:transcriptional regulator with XRE-family HTH domain